MKNFSGEHYLNTSKESLDGSHTGEIRNKDYLVNMNAPNWIGILRTPPDEDGIREARLKDIPIT